MRRWFLPETPDLLGLLSAQGAVTVQGVDALVAWSKGEPSAGAQVGERATDGELAARRVLMAVKVAFVTPIGPEDIYEISERLSGVLTAAADLVREAELVGMEPDPPMAEMVGEVALGVRNLAEAFPHLGSGSDDATASADAAVERQDAVEQAYRRAMSALLELDDLREVTGRRELYRRCARMGDRMVGVAHRIWYSVVKEA
jgi:uncharacterized protein Yka (UPF0111/DUF47 family)